MIQNFSHLRRTIVTMSLLFSLAVLTFPLQQAHAAGLSFQGIVKNASGDAIPDGTYNVRASLWADATEDAGDSTAGALVGSGFDAIQTVTVTDGYFFGFVTPTNYDASTMGYLQLEIKRTTDANTGFVLLDYAQGDTDRKYHGAYFADNAGNADTVGNKDLASFFNEAVADTTARDAIATPTNGMIVYVQSGTDAGLNYYNGTSWAPVDTNTTFDDASLQALITGNTTAIEANEAAIIVNAAAAAAAQTTANTAVTNAATAQTTADAAQTTANTAVTNAATAQATAVAAQANADANETDIATAQAAADAAQTTANTAVTNAATAQTAADAAQADADVAIADAATAQATADANTTAIATNATNISNVVTDLATNYYTQSEVDNQISGAVNGLSWKAPVATVGDLTTTYGSPTTGDTAMVTGTNEVYSWTGAGWNLIMANFAVQNATTSTAGIVTLGADGGTGTGVVQGNDSRLAQIATNTTDIATANSTISTNTANIVTNASAITTNSTDIIDNAADIVANTADVAINVTNIATNTADIAANKVVNDFDHYNIAVNW